MIAGLSVNHLIAVSSYTFLNGCAFQVTKNTLWTFHPLRAILLLTEGLLHLFFRCIFPPVEFCILPVFMSFLHHHMRYPIAQLV